MILGTDPDCDRVAIAVPDGDGFKKLSGNELGCLMLDYILKARAAKNDIPEGAIAVRSIVSSPLADKVAQHYGVEMKAVLTGFKYIGGEILELEQKGEEYKYMFGFEESCGYLKGTYARDKDAAVASMLVCEMAAFFKNQGKNILSALEDVYNTYGQYLAYVQSIELTGSDAMEKAAKMMADLRENAPTAIGGAAVTVVRDYRTSVAKNLVTGEESKILLPKSNVLEFILGDSGSVIARPSGTEPKVKFYYTAVASDKAAAKALLDAMVAHVESIVASLGLPYRILRLCGGDMSFTSALTYDFEVYSEAQQRWLEVSSVSNFESFQSNRLKLRYRDENRKNQLCHTLNGSSLALPRIVAALLENNQTSEGIRIPEALIPYTGFDIIK